jgi:hypothetical protein
MSHRVQSLIPLVENLNGYTEFNRHTMAICETTVHPMVGMFDFGLNQESRMDLLRVDK